MKWVLILCLLAAAFCDTQTTATADPVSDAKTVQVAEAATEAKATGEIERKLDLESFKKILEEIDCTQGDNAESKAWNAEHSLCDSNLEQIALSPLGKYGSSIDEINQFLDETVYKPLAYSMVPRNNLSDMLADINSLDSKNFLLDGHALQDNYGIFRDAILRIFSDVEGKTSDVEKNHTDINELIVQILKRFHLYWNTLRYKKQTAKVREDTVAVIKELSHALDDRQKFLGEVTRVLLTKVKDAYFRFMRAHKMLAFMNANAAEILVTQIIARYQDICDNIKESKFHEIKLVRETSFLLHMVMVYNYANYKNGYPEALALNKYETQLSIRIQTNYEMYKNILRVSDPIRLKSIRDFTATFLLKARHFNFIMFHFHNIATMLNAYQMFFDLDSARTAKIYNEVMDNLLVIPRYCIQILVMKYCVFHEANKVLRYVSMKYHLKRSTSGWEIYEYLRQLFHSIFSALDATTLNNFSAMKQVYYQSVYARMRVYLEHFALPPDDTVDELQNFVGEAIEDFKAKNQDTITDFGVLDLLEHKLYNHFLDLKGEYITAAPYDTNHAILTDIATSVHNLLAKFLKKNPTHLNDKAIMVLKVVEDATDKWHNHMLTRPQTSIQVTNLITPFATTLSTATFSNLSGDKPDSSTAVPQFLAQNLANPAESTRVDAVPAETQTQPEEHVTHTAETSPAANFSSVIVLNEPESKKVFDHFSVKKPINTLFGGPYDEETGFYGRRRDI